MRTHRLLALALTVFAVACGQGLSASFDDSATLAEGVQRERVGIHGMILVGEPSDLLLSHIPMFHAPHDVQLIARGNIVGTNRAIPSSFSDRLYTFVPKPLSLDALRLGKLKAITGAIYEGNFETDGRKVADNVSLAITGIVHQHELSPAEPQPELAYFIVGAGANVFAFHRIAGSPSFDEVLNVTLGRGGLNNSSLAAGLSVVARSVPDSPSQRLGLVTSTMTELSGAQLRISSVQSLSCLSGPMFTDACE